MKEKPQKNKRVFLLEVEEVEEVEMEDVEVEDVFCEQKKYPIDTKKMN